MPVLSMLMVNSSVRVAAVFMVFSFLARLSSESVNHRCSPRLARSPQLKERHESEYGGDGVQSMIPDCEFVGYKSNEKKIKKRLPRPDSRKLLSAWSFFT
jgi:hypothetical protein